MKVSPENTGFISGIFNSGRRDVNKQISEGKRERELKD